jgi:KEOPS complex subunit Cgi121
LLKYIEETGKYVEITGFRAVDIKDAEEFVTAVRKEAPSSVWIQFFDAKLVATWQHLYFAVLNALLAFRNRRNISKSVAVETLLYASAQTQISKAIQLIGVKNGSVNVALVIAGESPASTDIFLSTVVKRVGREPDETVLEVQKEKEWGIREAFGVTGKALETIMAKDDGEQALVNLVIEKMALLSTQL